MFPFTDLSGAKRRPALIVGRIASNDLVVGFITSRTTLQASPASHELARQDPEFAMSGLKVSSSIRLDKLASLHRSLVTRRLGSIGPGTLSAIESCLRYALDL
jgi:mRNA interferase MazF